MDVYVWFRLQGIKVVASRKTLNRYRSVARIRRQMPAGFSLAACTERKQLKRVTNTVRVCCLECKNGRITDGIAISGDFSYLPQQVLIVIIGCKYLLLLNNARF